MSGAKCWRGKTHAVRHCGDCGVNWCVDCNGEGECPACELRTCHAILDAFNPAQAVEGAS